MSSMFKRVKERNEITTRTVINLIFSIVLQFFVIILTGTLLQCVNYYRPQYSALPDIAHDVIPYAPTLFIADIMFFIAAAVEFLILILNYRLSVLIVSRRIIMAVTFIMLIQNLIMTITMVPESNSAIPKKYTEKPDFSFLSIIKTAINPALAGGHVFSLRVVIAVLPSIIHHHFVGGWMTYVFWIGAIFDFVLLAASRYVYTVDILITSYLTVTLFWIYQTISEKKELFNGYWGIFKWFFQNLEWCDPLSSESKENKVEDNIIE